jgi:hypothetical protein
MLLAAAYELKRRDIIADERTAARWNEPADELVAWLSQRHRWRADLSVSYLTTMLQLERTGHIPALDPLAVSPYRSAGGCARRDVEPAVQ